MSGRKSRRNRCSFVLALARIGVDKWGSWPADLLCRAGSLVAQMKRELIDRFRHLVALWIAGSVALAFATWACFQLGLNFATTALVFWDNHRAAVSDEQLHFICRFRRW
jgi:hypothetical protein